MFSFFKRLFLKDSDELNADKIKKEEKLKKKITQQNKLREEYKIYRKQNSELFKSAHNLKWSIEELREITPICSKCNNNNYTIWHLDSTIITSKCDNCNKLYTINNHLVEKVNKYYYQYLELESYCKLIQKKINIVWKQFKFDYSEFQHDTPKYRGIKYQALGFQVTELIKDDSLDKKSRRISQKVKDKVWRRDEGKCVECGSNENLEFDHIIPFSKGGANTYRNIQLLCQNCNRIKSNKIG